MNEELNQSPEPEQGTEQGQEQPDAIVLLAAELKEIRQALGLGENPGSSSLLARLNSIENNLGKSEREKNLPSAITWEQAGSVSFLRKNGIDLTDIQQGRVRVVKSLEDNQ